MILVLLLMLACGGDDSPPPTPSSDGGVTPGCTRPCWGDHMCGAFGTCRGAIVDERGTTTGCCSGGI